MPAVGAGRGSLTVVGTGIRPSLQTSAETRRCIERADKVLYLLAEQAPTRWIERLNPSAQSLASLYLQFESREDVYGTMVEEILTWVRKDLAVCVAFYGHPGVFVGPSHDAIRRARAEGYDARMLPAISAEDCLFADLGVDPAEAGCQSYEATDFLLHDRIVDPSVPLILWQISVIAEYRTSAELNRAGLGILAERLLESHGHDHEAVLYEASPFPVGHPTIERVRVRDLPRADVTPLSTLFVPPGEPSRTNQSMIDRLGIPGRDTLPTSPGG
jgi:uncharacterized protein YabN with tetrapyrrole methylase and pyrophosphatase domain